MARPVVELVEYAERLGVQFRIRSEGNVQGRRLKLLPVNIRLALHQGKQEVHALLLAKREQEHKCWVLEQWRRLSIPSWRRILADSEAVGDAARAEYARWMLREVLLDPGNDQREVMRQ